MDKTTRVISFANRKGGSGKSTSVVNLAALFADQKKNLLVVDMDSQSHATLSLGINPYSRELSLYEFLMEEENTFDEVCVHQEKWNIDILPASRRLASAEIELPGLERNQFLLREKISPYLKKYDYVFIDCPPALGPLSINALVASDYVVIPMTVHFLAMEGLVQMIDIINQISENLNPKLKIAGILPTFADTRTNLTNQILKELQKHFSRDMILPMIRRNVKLAEAPSFGTPINKYAPRSNGAADYRKVLNKLKKIINITTTEENRESNEKEKSKTQ